MFVEQWPTLSRGDRRSAVRDLQRQLSCQGHPIPQTGLFDYETELAVKCFQSRMNLTPDGVVGTRTWRSLCFGGPIGQPTLRRGSRGIAVGYLQEVLAIDLYYQGGCDDIFGAKTEAAVKRFQADLGLEPNGVVDHEVWRGISEI